MLVRGLSANYPHIFGLLGPEGEGDLDSPALRALETAETAEALDAEGLETMTPFTIKTFPWAELDMLMQKHYSKLVSSFWAGQRLCWDLNFR